MTYDMPPVTCRHVAGGISKAKVTDSAPLAEGRDDFFEVARNMFFVTRGCGESRRVRSLHSDYYIAMGRFIDFHKWAGDCKGC